MRLLFFIILFFFSLVLSAQIYISQTCTISFFSQAPIENIEAENTAAVPVLNTSTADLQVKIPIQAFKFKNGLMEEHFNENYMESDKYPHTIFKGKVNEQIDYAVAGKHNVTVTGKIDMHGVTKDTTINGTLTVEENRILINAVFPIHIADYNIKVPNMYVKNIAEDVTVTVQSTLEPYKKKNTSK